MSDEETDQWIFDYYCWYTFFANSHPDRKHEPDCPLRLDIDGWRFADRMGDDEGGAPATTTTE